MNHRRTGKVARLPRNARETVNAMLEDGQTYDAIIQRLAELGHPGFLPMNIHKWKNGGYREWYLKENNRHFIRAGNVEMVETRGNLAYMNLLSMTFAGHQFMEAFTDFDSATLGQQLNKNPERYFQLMLAYSRYLKNLVTVKKFIEEDKHGRGFPTLREKTNDLPAEAKPDKPAEPVNEQEQKDAA